MYMCLHIYIYTCAYVYMHMHMHVFMSMSVSMPLSMYICIGTQCISVHHNNTAEGPRVPRQEESLSSESQSSGDEETGSGQGRMCKRSFHLAVCINWG